jgi:hypothetical protein
LIVINKNEMKGGSIASSSVEQLVPVQAFEKLDIQFDNQVGGKKKSKGAAKKKTTAKKTNSKAKKQQGGVCFVCGGSMKHINEYDDEGLFNLYNKKGGANSPTFPMSYDYIDSISKPVHGLQIPRGLNTDVLSVVANDATSSLGSMNKTVAFGNILDVPKVPFNYTGGSKKPVKTAIKPAKKTQKSKSSPKKQK